MNTPAVIPQKPKFSVAITTPAYKKLIAEPVYSIYAARQENPNAYDPWTEEADAQLRQMWEDGTSVAEIAQHFGRKQSAIVVRMKKLVI